MDRIEYVAEVLPDGHLSLPEGIKRDMNLAVKSKVKIILEKKVEGEKAIEAFGAWSDRKDIKGGSGYLEKLRSGWSKRTLEINHD